jgi:cobalamin biosynthesis protein CobD/CbiB
MTFLLMVLVAGHVLALSKSDQPSCRKRIRMANGIVAMLTFGLMCAGLCVFTPEHTPREWALSWMAVMMLIALHVALAMADTINTARLRRQASAQIKDASRRLQEELVALGVRLDGDASRSNSD